MSLLLAAVMAAGAAFAPLLHASAWLGTPPTAQRLANKVVIVDVFTFDCINCKHVVPELRKLHASLPPSDFAIIGIHSPETPYERDRGNVVQNLQAQGITWPVAIDNDFTLWHAYGIEYWPTQLIFDRHGNLRKTVIGEGQDDAVASEVRELLRER
jgi:thiol-disulfide isomerase/thioredoxin